jgi:c-di-GMP-binding flagellar brake protein YcgR
MSERRKHFRYSVRVDVEIEWPSQALRASKSFVPVSDISLGGMFIITCEPLPIGSEFSMCIFLDKPLRLRCAVQHFVPGRGMGVKFLDMADSSQIKLSKFLEAIAEQTLALIANQANSQEVGLDSDTTLLE